MSASATCLPLHQLLHRPLPLQLLPLSHPPLAPAWDPPPAPARYAIALSILPGLTLSQMYLLCASSQPHCHLSACLATLLLPYDTLCIACLRFLHFHAEWLLLQRLRQRPYIHLHTPGYVPCLLVRMLTLMPRTIAQLPCRYGCVSACLPSKPSVKRAYAL